AELLEDTAPGGVRKRGKRGVEARSRILNHMVQYLMHESGARKDDRSRGARERCTPCVNPTDGKDTGLCDLGKKKQESGEKKSMCPAPTMDSKVCEIAKGKKY